MADYQQQMDEQLEQIRVALHQIASETQGLQPPRPEPWNAADNANVQVIVEIEAKAATVERLFMISERQEWTFGETLEYALDTLELALAKVVTD